MTDDNRILIVGAGPVGLTLACLLAQAGTPFRLIDAKPGPIEDSRALGVHARTLEIMQSLGLSEAFINAGRVTRYMTFHLRNRPLFSFDFEVLRRDTAYPFYLILPQSSTEALLYQKLLSLGGTVEWNTPLRSLEETDRGVIAHFEGESRCYPYAVGADGAGSVVRKSLGIAFSGHTYEARFVLSEVRIAEDRLATDATHVILADRSVLAAIPLPNGLYRLVGPDSMASTELESGARIGFDTFAAFLERNGLFPETRLYDPSRVVSYRMQKRVADRFMSNRVFLAGDAAHIHSPAGGQGMNMGIQDAANLGWKLSLAWQGGARKALLESYREERHRIAQTVADGTDRALQLVSSRKLHHRLALRAIAPLLCRVRQPYRLIHAMAQLGIGYGAAPTGAGARLPWLRCARGGDLFDLLSPGKLTLFHLGPVEPVAAPVPLRVVRLVDNRFYRLSGEASGDPVETHPVVRAELTRLGGVARLLVRPDGYVAAVDRTPENSDIARYLAQLAAPQIEVAA